MRGHVLNMHEQLSSEVRGLNFELSLPLLNCLYDADYLKFGSFFKTQSIAL